MTPAEHYQNLAYLIVMKYGSPMERKYCAKRRAELERMHRAGVA